jgi:hypothetical protein
MSLLLILRFQIRIMKDLDATVFGNSAIVISNDVQSLTISSGVLGQITIDMKLSPSIPFVFSDSRPSKILLQVLRPCYSIVLILCSITAGDQPIFTRIVFANANVGSIPLVLGTSGAQLNAVRFSNIQVSFCTNHRAFV